MTTGPGTKKTHYKKLLPDTSEHLGQWDLQRPDGTYAEPVVEIESVSPYRPRVLRKVKQPDGTYAEEKVKRLAIAFVGKRKRWLAGTVSHEALKAMFGPYIEDWVGRRITLYFDPSVMFGRTRTGGIRVRPTPPGANEEPTSDPLDRPVDEDAVDRIEEARSEFTELEEGAAQ